MKRKYDLFVTDHPTAGKTMPVMLSTGEEAESWKYLCTLSGPKCYAVARAETLVNEYGYQNVRVFTGGRSLGRLVYTARR